MASGESYIILSFYFAAYPHAVQRHGALEPVDGRGAARIGREAEDESVGPELFVAQALLKRYRVYSLADVVEHVSLVGVVFVLGAFPAENKRLVDIACVHIGDLVVDILIPPVGMIVRVYYQYFRLPGSYVPARFAAALLCKRFLILKTNCG
jgi:hypothetical protein